MKNIQVYDPPMCCSTSTGGMHIDPDRLNFVTLLAQLRAQGIRSERYNLTLDPTAFAQNAAVKSLMDKEGISGLPVIFWDDAIRLTGRYPTQDERTGWLRTAVAHESAA